MRIEWVNHASFVVEHGDVRLLSDPWLDGTAFDDGWQLLCESPFGPTGFERITHIWISHEHPDHFNPTTLRAIPAAARQRIVVVFQQTRDKKVVEFCRGLGFGDVQELPSGAWFNIGDDVRVMCQPFPNNDSWLAVNAGNHLLLNLNDCIVQTPQQIERVARALDGQPIDVLATQFSYASWVGNPGELDRLRAAAQRHLQRMKLQADILQPRYVLPFASFIWFCHEENWYLNEGVNSVRQAFDYLSAETAATPVVLYPGESWVVGAEHRPEAALERYEGDYERVRRREGLVTSPQVGLDEVRELADRWLAQVTAHHGRLTLRALQLAGLLQPAHIYLADHDVAVGLAIPQGLRKSSRPRDRCDIELSSAALAYCFRHMWGGNTLLVNGRYRTPPEGNFQNFRRYLVLSDLVNHGQRMDGYIRPQMRRILDQALERLPLPGRAAT